VIGSPASRAAEICGEMSIIVTSVTSVVNK